MKTLLMVHFRETSSHHCEPEETLIFLLLSSLVSALQKPHKMQIQQRCFTSPPLEQELKAQRLSHLLKAAQTLWESPCWT